MWMRVWGSVLRAHCGVLRQVLGIAWVGRPAGRRRSSLRVVWTLNGRIDVMSDECQSFVNAKAARRMRCGIM